jgi:competence protein ComEA
MPEIPPRQLLAWAVAIGVVVLLGVWYLGRDAGAAAPPPPPGAAPAIRVEQDGGGRVIVHVAGEVHRPGVYRLPAGSRVEEAVGRAGGARPRADLSAVNLAAKVEDGRQIVVPRRAPAGAVPATAGGAAGAAPGAGPAVPINLNTATLEQLDTLDGVGPATAQKILAYRDEHGGFGSVEELGQVSGIGEKRLAALREKVRV